MSSNIRPDAKCQFYYTKPFQKRRFGRSRRVPPHKATTKSEIVAYDRELDVQGCNYHSYPPFWSAGENPYSTRLTFIRSAALTPTPTLGAQADGLAGLSALLLKARVLNPPAAAALERELLDLGANGVDEVLPGDWENLTSWPCLWPFEQRRFLAAV